MRPLLLTGFEPFLDYARNPSGLLAEALDDVVHAGFRIEGEVLPVAYDRADAAFFAAFARARPSAVLLFGLAFETDALRLERIALNLDDTVHADNEGTVRWGRPIEAEGPVAYRSTLPVDRLLDRLTAAAVPVVTSRDAGGYLCNHLFFRARHHIEGLGLSIPCGFIHVPPLVEQVADRPGRTGLTLLRLVEAAKLVIETLAETNPENAPAA